MTLSEKDISSLKNQSEREAHGGATIWHKSKGPHKTDAQLQKLRGLPPNEFEVSPDAWAMPGVPAMDPSERARLDREDREIRRKAGLPPRSSMAKIRKDQKAINRKRGEDLP